MNQDISGLSSTTKLTSKPRASFEKATPAEAKGVECSKATSELKQFEAEMEQINHAFTLVKEIRDSLETALKNLD